MGDVMGLALKIRDELRSLELRRWACRGARGRSAARAYAIANAFEGMARAAAARLVGMDPGRSVPVAADLCRWLEGRFAKTYHPSSMTRVLRRMGFSRQKARPAHRQRDAEAQERFKKGGFTTS